MIFRKSSRFSCTFLHYYCRRYSSTRPKTRGLLLGVYQTGDKDAELVLTPSAQNYENHTGGKLTNLLRLTKHSFKKGESRILYGLDEEYSCISVVSLGPKNAGYNELEELQEGRENVRVAVGNGIKSLRTVGVTEVDVDACGDAEASAEASQLVLFSYDELKKEESRKPPIHLKLLEADNGKQNKWNIGMMKAQSQNLARKLMETPSNYLTPTRFQEIVTDVLGKKNVEVQARDQKWIEEQKMEAFLSVAKGSDEPPVFLELNYKGSTDNEPVALVGKGVTFDSGGISIKPSANMDKMRGDMGGAACVVGVLHGLAALNVPLHVKGFIPLCENMPSGKATKPGDVVRAMNGKTIQVDNTDAEGRLILADALCYAHKFKPKAVIDMATLTGAMAVALGNSATGVFSTSPSLWNLLHQAGTLTGDRVWRMPVFQHHSNQIKSHLADINNISRKGGAGSCTAAAFLKEFVDCKHWMHLDIAGVMENTDEVSYLCAGLTGRPVRTLIEFFEQLSKKQDLIQGT